MCLTPKPRPPRRAFVVCSLRSPDEVAAQTRAVAKGIDGDQGGINMLPQNGMSTENELAGWVAADGTVKFDVGFDDFVGDRPETVRVQYVVTNDAGKEIYRNADLSDNAAGQAFDRVSTSDIAALMARG